MTPSGLVIVDKPKGLTSHDVVARVRRLAGTRRVGHAGTLDPMATGVLVVGVEKATRLLGHLALTSKEYAATIRLGQSTTTDDAEGEPVSGAPASSVGDERVSAAIAALTGDIMQVPPGVSAIKVNGHRAYKLTRAGQAPELAARPVTVSEFKVTAVRHDGDMLNLDAVIACSSGTYIRALARDLGAALGTGGHLASLRRTRVGAYGIAQARTLDDLAEMLVVTPLETAAAAAFPRRDLTADEATRLSHGGFLQATRPGPPPSVGPGDQGAAADPDAPGDSGSGAPIAAFAPDGTLVALIAEEPGRARPIAVFTAG